MIHADVGAARADNKKTTEPIPTNHHVHDKAMKTRKRKALDITDDISNVPSLPAPVWGHILDFLPYKEVRSTLLICKTVGVLAVEHVGQLTLLRSCELEARCARRFKNVRTVKIYCLINNIQPAQLYDDCTCTLDVEATSRVVTFLATFPRLAFVRLCGYHSPTRRLYPYRPENCHSPRDHRDVLRGFMVSLCGAFRSGALPQSLQIEGLLNAYQCEDVSATDGHGDQEGRCSFCRSICNSFPLNYLRWLVAREQSCIPTDEIIRIIKGRNWTDKCLRVSLSSSIIKCSHFRLRDQNEFVPSFVQDMRRSGSITPDNIYYIPTTRLKMVLTLLELDNGKIISNGEALLPLLVPGHPKGGYTIANTTMTALQSVIDVSGLRDKVIIVDDKNEPALAHLKLDDVDTALYNEPGHESS